MMVPTTSAFSHSSLQPATDDKSSSTCSYRPRTTQQSSSRRKIRRTITLMFNGIQTAGHPPSFDRDKRLYHTPEDILGPGRVGSPGPRGINYLRGVPLGIYPSCVGALEKMNNTGDPPATPPGTEG